MAKPNTKKGSSIDYRIAVAFKTSGGKDKGTPLYSRVRKSVADKLGLKQVSPVSDKKTKKGGQDRPLRGSTRAGSMKIPVDDKGKYVSVPVPSKATIADMRDFCKRLKDVKPTHFITPDGARYDIVQKGAK